jgi:hypothetical protein
MHARDAKLKAQLRALLIRIELDLAKAEAYPRQLGVPPLPFEHHTLCLTQRRVETISFGGFMDSRELESQLLVCWVQLVVPVPHPFWIGLDLISHRGETLVFSSRSAATAA